MADVWIFHDFIFTNESAKAHTLQWVVGFFEGLNFTNNQHPRNLRNLRTSKKPTIQYSSVELLVSYIQWNL